MAARDDPDAPTGVLLARLGVLLLALALAAGPAEAANFNVNSNLDTADYALSGHMPELLGIYNLLGDPGMTIR